MRHLKTLPALHAARHRAWMIAVSLACLSWATAPPFAAQGAREQQLALEAEHGGWLYALAVDERHAYASLHSRLLAFDAATPGAPPVALSAPTGPPVLALAVRDGLVAGVGEDLLLWREPDAGSLALLGRLKLPIGVEDVILVGEEAWLRGRGRASAARRRRGPHAPPHAGHVAAPGAAEHRGRGADRLRRARRPRRAAGHMAGTYATGGHGPRAAPARARRGGSRRGRSLTARSSRRDTG